MNELRTLVEALIKGELKRANKKFPLFHSDHEAVAIIEEEMREASVDANVLSHNFDNFKEAVFDDYSISDKRECIENIEQFARELACESIQIAAMAQKWKMSHITQDEIKKFSCEKPSYLNDLDEVMKKWEGKYE